MRAWRALLGVPVLTLLVIAFAAPPVSARSVPGKVRNISVEIDDDELEIAWSRPDDDGGARIREYEVQLDGRTRRTGSREIELDLPQPGNHRVQVRARNSHGWGAWQSSAQFSVRAPAVPSVVRNIRLEVRNRDDLILSFDRPADDGDDRIREYRIRIRGQVFEIGTSRQIRIRNVNDGAYRVEVSARNRNGWGPWGASNEVRVGAVDKPGSVRSLQAGIGNDRTIDVSWNVPSDLGGAKLEGYVLRVAPNFERRLAADETSTVLAGFNPGPYVIRVSAITAAGEGPATPVMVELEGPPAPPERRVGPFANATLFVDRQYQDLFERAADPDGRAFWASQLNDDATNAAQVIDSMMSAPEFRPSYQAIRLYLAYFNRLPDNDGLNYWVRILKEDRATLGVASSAFAGSAEFRARYGPLDDRDFVALVYNNVLLRPPDPEGYGYWTRQLRLGLTRGEMMVLFSDSQEFKTSSNPAVQTVAIYNAMLDRSPTPEEFQKWIAHIGANPSDRLALIEGIFTSGTYRNRIS